MTVHHLKTWPEYFSEVLAGRKAFEVRRNDRDFHVGDTLRLCEWDPQRRAFTGRFVMKIVTYILPGGQFGIEPGYCVMNITYPSNPIGGPGRG